MDLFDAPPQQAGSQQGGSPQTKSPAGGDPMAFLASNSPPAAQETVPVMDAFAGMTAPDSDLPGGRVSEKVKEWEAEQEQKAEKKAQEELQKKKAKREEANQALTAWYAERKDKITKTRALNRKEEKEWISLQGSTQTGKNPWERVLNLIPEAPHKPDAVTLNQDTTRFKQILTNLQAEPIPN